MGETRKSDPRGGMYTTGTARRPRNPGKFGRDFPANYLWPRTAAFPAPKDHHYKRDMTGPHGENANARPTYACYNCGEANYNIYKKNVAEISQLPVFISNREATQ